MVIGLTSFEVDSETYNKFRLIKDTDINLYGNKLLV